MTSTPQSVPTPDAGPEAARAFCERAVAYLKTRVPDDDDHAPVTELSRDDTPVMHQLGDELLVAYLVDEGDFFRYVQVKHLALAGFSEDALRASAVANLRARAAQEAEVKAYGNIFAVLMDDHFEASLLLVDDFWNEWYAAQAPNGVVAAIPARGLLAFGDKGSRDALRELDDFCTRISGSADHPLTDTLFERVAGRWQPLARATTD